MYGARWNSQGTEVIYAASTLEGALLELRVHTSGLPPPSKLGYIWIDLPAGTTYERAARSQIPDWRRSQEATSEFGDKWIRDPAMLRFVRSQRHHSPAVQECPHQSKSPGGRPHPPPSEG